MNTTRKTTIRDFLYEEPGPKTKRKIRIATIIAFVLVIALIVAIINLFVESGQLDARYWSFFTRLTTWKFIGNGLLGTLEAAIVAGIIAFTLGFIFMLGRISSNKVLSNIAMGLIEFSRGVPTLLFIYFFFLVVPQFGINLPTILRISIPVALGAAGKVAEILRSGIQAVPKGQWEAAYSLGMSEWKVFTKVIFPQAFKYVIPALISDLVIVVKDTTFAYIVNFPDLMQNARVLISNYDALLSVYLVTAILYILINYILNKLSLLLARDKNVKIDLQEL